MKATRHSGTLWEVKVGSRPVWPDLAKFRHFGQILKVFGNFLRGYWVFCQLVNPCWQMFCGIWQIVIVKNGQILKNILHIWSHWTRQRERKKDKDKRKERERDEVIERRKYTIGHNFKVFLLSKPPFNLLPPSTQKAFGPKSGLWLQTTFALIPFSTTRLGKISKFWWIFDILGCFWEALKYLLLSLRIISLV